MKALLSISATSLPSAAPPATAADAAGFKQAVTTFQCDPNSSAAEVVPDAVAASKSNESAGEHVIIDFEAMLACDQDGLLPVASEEGAGVGSE